jgi:POT family proton-dependent oligopeptide transporter
MAIGELILFFCGSVYQSSPDLSALLFFCGLGFMIAGNGFFKPNISIMVGQLYPKGDIRKDSAYTLFYMGINLGGALGPIICGLVGDTGNPADFRWAFLVGGIGMILSVITLNAFHHKYVVDPDKKVLGLPPANGAATRKPVVIVGILAAMVALSICMIYVDAKVLPYLSWLLVIAPIGIALMIFGDKTLNAIEKKQVGVIFIVCFFVIFFWGAFEQAGASLTFFANEQTERDLGFWVIPTSFFQALNSIFVVAFAGFFAWLWLRLGKKQPSSPTKMAFGLAFLALGYLWIAYGVDNIPVGKKVSIIWLTGMYALHTCGELCLSPIGLSLVNKLAPAKFASLLMAVWFMANAMGNKLAGVLSALYPENGKTTSFLGYHMSNLHEFFLLFVIMAGFASALLFLITKPVQKMMHEA